MIPGPIWDVMDWMATLAETGPDVRINAHKKAAHEAQELAESPSLEELADVLICLIGTAVQHGWSIDDVMAAVTRKTKINRARTWVEQPDGTWQHS